MELSHSKKYPFRLIAALLCSLILSACAVEAPKDPSTLLFSLSAEPDTLNRLTATDAYEGTVNGFIFDALIERDNRTLEYKPKLATQWEVSDDKLTYTFHLRNDVKWHDGKPFTADDVIYTFQQITNEKVDAGPLRNYYKDIKNAEKLDDYTVRFTYAIPYFKALEFVGGIPVIPKHVFDDGQDFNNHPAGRRPIGTGPFKFKEWNTNKNIVLERNEAYWDKEKFPDYRRVLFKIIPDSTIVLQVLKKGELDVANLRPIQWVRQTLGEGFNNRFARHQYYLPGYRYIGWNQQRPNAPFFKDKKVRQALSHLVNRQDIVNKLEFGLAKLTNGPFWVFGYEYNRKLPQILFDPAKAKLLLEEAGWSDRDNDGIREKDGVKFEFTFLIPAGSASANRLATILKKDLEDAGISMQIQSMEWAAFVNRLNAKDFDAVTLGWTGSIDEDPYQIWHSSQIEKGSNYTGFKNEEADRIMEEARTVFDKERRTQLYNRFHEIIYDEQPYTFLYTGASLLARDRRFKNVQVYKLGVDFLEWKVAQ